MRVTTKKLLWFAGLWVFGVAALGLVALLLRVMLRTL